MVEVDTFFEEFIPSEYFGVYEKQRVNVRERVGCSEKAVQAVRSMHLAQSEFDMTDEHRQALDIEFVVDIAHGRQPFLESWSWAKVIEAYANISLDS